MLNRQNAHKMHFCICNVLTKEGNHKNDEKNDKNGVNNCGRIDYEWKLQNAYIVRDHFWDLNLWIYYHTYLLTCHSSEIRGLCSTKCSSETLQKLLYFMYKKTHVVFFVFHFVQLYIFTLWMPRSMSI